MEFLLLYMDDLDDLAGALGLLYERIRRLVLGLLTLTVGGLIVAAGIWLALAHPPLALATCLLMFVTLFYRTVTSPARDALHSA